MPVWLQASIISHFGVNGLPDERLVLYECPEDGTDASPNVHQGTNTCSLFSLSSSLFIENNRAFKERRTLAVVNLLLFQDFYNFKCQSFAQAHSATKNSSEVAMRTNETTWGCMDTRHFFHQYFNAVFHRSLILVDLLPLFIATATEVPYFDTYMGPYTRLVL
ncbi:hypothetical protein T4C_11582 [Trichinella pseudospiralis]|uniref:Uncharacterized protein n=1 Tax=Trichinella pseudospiralis TaxID=6337 RepID=A0A0V1KAV4_TRIPS|nr:hypothetical protein T4C_11582 [Trichinella pseudospiralis]